MSQQTSIAKCRLRGRVEMAREIDANLSKAFDKDLRLSHPSSKVGNEINDIPVRDHNETGADTSTFSDDINFDGEDIDALNAFSSLFGGLPAVKLGLVDISIWGTKGKSGCQTLMSPVSPLYNKTLNLFPEALTEWL